MKQLKYGSYILVDNETGKELFVGNEDQIKNTFIEQNEREYNQIANRTYQEVQNMFKSNAIINGGEEVFRKIALGKSYASIVKMIDNCQITQELGEDIMKALELYAFNEETPLTAEEGREYYNRLKNFHMCNN